jgi:hypothetical protein
MAVTAATSRPQGSASGQGNNSSYLKRRLDCSWDLRSLGRDHPMLGRGCALEALANLAVTSGKIEAI